MRIYIELVGTVIPIARFCCPMDPERTPISYININLQFLQGIPT